jgi:hypothetical protein
LECVLSLYHKIKTKKKDMETLEKIKQLAENVNDGWVNALDAYIELQKILLEAESALERIKPLAVKEAYLYPEKSFEKNGVLIEKRNTPSRWDYSSCEAIKMANENLKRLQKIAQNGGVDPVTGELLKATKIEGVPSFAIKILIS